MKRRFINRNTMKVIVTRADLKNHGITALDLLGSHQKIKQFFYSILKEADPTHHFSASDPLVFRVLPSNEGLQILISRRSRSSIGKINNYQTNQSPVRSKTSLLNDVISFGSFEDYVKLAQILQISYGTSNLYHYNGKYYLGLNFHVAANPIMINKIKNKLAIAYEYGAPTTLTEEFLNHNGRILIKNQALTIGRRYFK